jgi:hypothetical protein
MKIPPALRPLPVNEGATIIDAWNCILKGASPMRHITVEEWMKTVDQVDDIDPAWREYIQDRYGI